MRHHPFDRFRKGVGIRLHIPNSFTPGVTIWHSVDITARTGVRAKSVPRMKDGWLPYRSCGTRSPVAVLECLRFTEL